VLNYRCVMCRNVFSFTDHNSCAEHRIEIHRDIASWLFNPEEIEQIFKGSTRTIAEACRACCRKKMQGKNAET